MADWFRNRVLITKNADSDKGFKELSDLLNAYDENSEESEKFLSFVDCPITKFILLSDEIEVYHNEIQFGIISAYRPVFELKEICNKYKCDVHVVYAHEREELNDWDGEPSIGRFSACLKNNEVVFEQKSPDAADPKEVHEFFSMAWDDNISPDPIDRDTFFDQHDIGYGFYIKDYEDDDVGISPSFKQWLGLEKIDAPFGLVGYEDEYDAEDEDYEEEEGVSYEVHDSLEDFLQSINDDDDEEYDNDDEYDDDDDYDNSAIDYDDEEFEIEDGILNKYLGTKSEVIIPDGVRVIGEYAFGGNTSISSIVIPGSVKSIGEEGDCETGYVFEGCTNLKKVVISEGVEIIWHSAFEGCTSLTEIIIPDSVKFLGDCAFFDCTSLKSIKLSESLTTIGGNDYDCETGIFENCTSLTSISIPSSVKTIGESAFKECTSLKEIIIPDTVKEIQCDVFAGCTNLSSVTLPEGIEAIKYNTFSDCKSLESISIPDGVRIIGDFTFDGCTSLKSVKIPDTVTSIGEYAFRGCTSLSEESKKSIRDHGYEGEF